LSDFHEIFEIVCSSHRRTDLNLKLVCHLPCPVDGNPAPCFHSVDVSAKTDEVDLFVSFWRLYCSHEPFSVVDPRESSERLSTMQSALVLSSVGLDLVSCKA